MNAQPEHGAYFCPTHGFVQETPCEKCEAAAAATAVPDVIGELVGWRAWEIIGNDVTPRLASVTARDFGVSAVDAIWPPDRWYYALCTMRGHKDVPHEGCACGLYAAKELDHLIEYGYARWGNDGFTKKVIGTVGLSGKVIPGRQGYKAERARVLTIIVPSIMWKRADRLRELYRCDVYIAAALGLSDLWA